MFSKPLAFGLLALGCLAAAAGGAYVATRHNTADAAGAAVQTAPAAARPATPAQPQPVTETEATVAPRTDSTPASPSASPAAPAASPDPSPRVTVTPHEAKAPGKRAERATAPAQEHADHPAAGSEPAAPAAQPQTQAPQPQAPSIAPVEPPRQPDPQPDPPRMPQFEEVVVPASSVIGLQVQTPLTSERAHVEDRVEARVTRDVHAGDRLAIPAGARVLGSVTLVERGGKVKERARLGIRFHTLVLADGTAVPLQTEAIVREGESPVGDSTKKIGGAAIGGAILGAILGGGKGAVVGGMAGAGGGTAAVMAGDRNAATIPSGAIVTARLSAPVTIQVEKREQ